MTRVTGINRIEMKGFKSFNKKTEAIFGDGFNCVIGPNGAGKSNVFDALIFVLGKSGSKGLRAEKTANLIYNGGKSKEPAKQGEVSIIFDNAKDIFATGNPELELKRVVKHSGASTYYIDGKSHTRQQVLELLSRAKIEPDSHNIILQGDIVMLVEMSPLDRRGMIEEIAGISIYEDKKEKALRELNRVEERLNEAQIILTERKSYLRELKKERDQAFKFKDLDEKIKRNKATLLHQRMKVKKAEIEKFNKTISENKIKVDKVQQDIEIIQDKIAKKKQEADEINKEIELKGEKEQVAMHKQVEELRVNLALKEQRLRTIHTELQKLDDRKKELENNLKDLESKIKGIDSDRLSVDTRIRKKEEEILGLEKKIGEYRKKHNIEDASQVDKRLEEIDKEAEQVQESIQTAREEQQTILREKDTIEIQLQGIDEKISKVLGLEKENKVAVQQLKHDQERLKKVTHELNQRLENDSKLASEWDTARSKLEAKREELSRLEARSVSIREGVAGGAAISAILSLKKKWKGIYGTITELGKVSSQHSLALEIAAGSRIRSIVVDSDETAAKCIRHLKENKLGVATFLPLNKLKPQIISTEARTIKGKGIHGLAIELVDYDKKFEKAFHYVFGGTVVVDNINTARKIGVGKARMVTGDGDLVELSGAMQGGHRVKQRSGLGFQDKQVAGDLERLKEEVEDDEVVVANLSKQRSENVTAIDKLRAERAETEGSVIKLEKTLHIDSEDMDASKDRKAELNEELGKVEKKLTQVQATITQSTKQLTDLKIERQKHRETLSNLRNPAVLAEINSFAEKRNELKTEIAEVRGESRGFNSEIDNILNPERDSIMKIIRQHEKENKDFEAEQRTVEKDVAKQIRELKQMEETEKKFYSKFKALFERRQKLGEEVTKLENDILHKNDKIRESENKSNMVSIEHARLKAELSGLEEENKQHEGVSIYREKNEEQIKREVAEFERMASGIGAVNMKALEIYEHIENEYNKLVEKKGKLEVEKEDVLVMINKIDSRKKDLFMKTFDTLNGNFKRIFATLSTKGEASLENEDKKDPFNGGVNIKVRLSGKKFLDIRSLSGGEKTLTALSFIFAVQEHEPAPFYIMDEVDAALDKRNSEKLSSLLRAYSHRAQYIIVSHNDAVIGEATNLYGVSMNEHGESKITTLKI